MIGILVDVQQQSHLLLVQCLCIDPAVCLYQHMDEIEDSTPTALSVPTVYCQT